MCSETERFKEHPRITSKTERFLEPIPELFSALTQYPDSTNKWTSYQVPVLQGG